MRKIKSLRWSAFLSPTCCWEQHITLYYVALHNPKLEQNMWDIDIVKLNPDISTFSHHQDPSFLGHPCTGAPLPHVNHQASCFFLALISLKTPTNHKIFRSITIVPRVNFHCFLMFSQIFLHVSHVFLDFPPFFPGFPRFFAAFPTVFPGACVEGHAAAPRLELRARDAGDAVELLLSMEISMGYLQKTSGLVFGGGTVGSWLCSRKTLVPNPKAYVFQPGSKNMVNGIWMISRISMGYLDGTWFGWDIYSI